MMERDDLLSTYSWDPLDERRMSLVDLALMCKKSKSSAWKPWKEENSKNMFD